MEHTAQLTSPTNTIFYSSKTQFSYNLSYIRMPWGTPGNSAKYMHFSTLAWRYMYVHVHDYYMYMCMYRFTISWSLAQCAMQHPMSIVHVHCTCSTVQASISVPTHCQTQRLNVYTLSPNKVMSCQPVPTTCTLKSFNRNCN